MHVTSMTPPLAGKTALVTGAARRLGAAMARGLHARGANVVIHHHRSTADARALAIELNGTRADSALALQADLRDVATLPDLVTAAATHFGAFDILVNSASTFYPTPMGEITIEQWDDLLGTNLKAPLFLAQAAAPLLKQRQGLIVNLIDIHAQRPLKDYPVYCAAKAGLAMLTRSLARELGPDVRVNGIAPGPILWPEGGLDAEIRDQIIEQTALKRSGGPDDIVGALLFFAIDAPYVTGQILAVDGGRSLGW
jgi:pteridine reductase